MTEQAGGGPLWPATDLITPMALRVAATLRVAGAKAENATSRRSSTSPTTSLTVRLARLRAVAATNQELLRG